MKLVVTSLEIDASECPGKVLGTIHAIAIQLRIHEIIPVK